MHLRIKQRREELGLSRADLATAIGLKSAEAIRQWESGDTSPTKKNLDPLAKTLKVSREWLLTGQEKDASLPSPETLEWAKKWERLPPSAQEFLGSQIDAYLRLAERNPVLAEIMSRAPKGKAQKDFENHLAKYGKPKETR